jgi:hypothetical protein
MKANPIEWKDETSSEGRWRGDMRNKFWTGSRQLWRGRADSHVHNKADSTPKGKNESVDVAEAIEDGGVDDLVEERPNYFAEIAKAKRRERWKARRFAALRVFIFGAWLVMAFALIVLIAGIWAWRGVQQTIKTAWARWMEI